VRAYVEGHDFTFYNYGPSFVEMVNVSDRFKLEVGKKGVKVAEPHPFLFALPPHGRTNSGVRVC